jgi:hypothetical protein
MGEGKSFYAEASVAVIVIFYRLLFIVTNSFRMLTTHLCRSEAVV